MIKLWIYRRAQLPYPLHKPSALISNDGIANLKKITWYDRGLLHKTSDVKIGMDLLTQGFKI